MVPTNVVLFYYPVVRCQNTHPHAQAPLHLITTVLPIIFFIFFNTNHHLSLILHSLINMFKSLLLFFHLYTSVFSQLNQNRLNSNNTLHAWTFFF